MLSPDPWAYGMRTTDWQHSAPSNARMSGDDYRDIWFIWFLLSGVLAIKLTCDGVFMYNVFLSPDFLRGRGAKDEAVVRPRLTDADVAARLMRMRYAQKRTTDAI